MDGIAEFEFPAGSLFLGIVPDTDPASRIYRLAKVLKSARKFRGGVTEQNRLHITLFFLGDGRCLSGRIGRLLFAAVAEVRMQPFEVSFDRTASFRGRAGNRPFVLLGDNGTSRLKSFRGTLGAAMTRHSLNRWSNTDFNPHITLLYDACKVEEQPIEPISWTVSEFVLIHSMDGHKPLARWPLRG
jgi:RNA 2',3'-cyclic 3'-phosphodiesterase